MKILILICSLFFSTVLYAEEISDFNAPFWNYGTGNGADASASGTINGVPFTIGFDLNTGSKIFTEPPSIKTNQHTSNSTIGHGGRLGSLLLGGAGERLIFNFDSPVTITLGLGHVNISTERWDFLTPADEVISLNAVHETTGTTNITGFTHNSALGATSSDPTQTSYFRWNNVTTIELETIGAVSSTLALSSMRMNAVTAVPSLSFYGLLILISLLGFVAPRLNLSNKDSF